MTSIQWLLYAIFYAFFYMNFGILVTLTVGMVSFVFLVYFSKWLLDHWDFNNAELKKWLTMIH